MKLHRIYAIILRHLYNFIHSYDRLTDAFYWPSLDLLLWGLTISYFSSISPNSGKVVLAVVAGILFWVVTWRGQYEISINLLVELWDKNLLNLFVSPLKFSEWVTALILVGFIKAFISLSFASFLAFIFYQVNIFTFGFYLLPFLFLLIMTGWWIGFTIAALILRYGTKIQTIAWTVTWAAAPFSAIYFPVSILPKWAQFVSHFMPTSYIFEGAREIVFQGILDWNKVYISFGLNIFYCILSLLFFRNSFKKALERGLQSIY